MTPMKPLNDLFLLTKSSNNSNKNFKQPQQKLQTTPTKTSNNSKQKLSDNFSGKEASSGFGISRLYWCK